MARTYLDTILDAGTTPLFRATMKDAAGVVVPAASLTGVWITLYDKGSQAILNGWHRRDALNASGVSIDSGGVLRWVLTAADMARIDQQMQPEEHVILVEVRWTASGIPRVVYDETVFRVRAVPTLWHVPALMESASAQDAATSVVS
jgi:hypothetical protein